MFAFLSNFRIRPRVYSGFGIILILLVGFSVFSHVNLDSSAESQHHFIDVMDATFKIQQVERNLVGLRRTVLSLVANGDKIAEQRAQELRDGLVRDLDSLMADPAAVQVRAGLRDMKEALTSYTEKLQALAALRSEQAALLKSLDSRVEALTSGDLRTVDLAAFAGQHADHHHLVTVARENLVGVVRAVNRYMGDNERRSADDASARLQSAKGDLAKVVALGLEGEAGQAVARMTESMKGIGDAAERLIVVAGRFNQLYRIDMAAIGERFTKLAAESVKQMRASLTHMDEVFDAEMDQLAKTSLEVSGVLVVLGLMVAWVISSSIVNPVRSMTEAMARLAQGDLSVPVPGLQDRDEVGEMAQAVQVFKRNAEENRRLQEEKAATERSRLRRQEESDELIEMFGASVAGVFNSLSQASSQMSGTAAQMNTAAVSTNEQVDVVADAVKLTSENAGAVAAAAQELTAAIGEISRLISDSTATASDASSQAQQGVERVTALREASERIGRIVTIIEDIATRTNLLALNATIEAARAGEAGKGFAVVANEVKMLSNQTQKATAEIAQQISGIQDSVGGAAETMQNIGSTIQRLHEAANNIAAAVTEQQSVTDEIARNVEIVSSKTADIANSIDTVREAAQGTTVASSSVRTAAASMSGQADKLSVEVKDFLSALKSAGTREEFERQETSLGVRITCGGRTISGRVTALSAGGAWIDIPLPGIALGSAVELDIDRVDRAILARMAGNSGRGARLQFPMDDAHLDVMTRVMHRLFGAASAA